MAIFYLRSTHAVWGLGLSASPRGVCQDLSLIATAARSLRHFLRSTTDTFKLLNKLVCTSKYQSRRSRHVHGGETMSENRRRHRVTKKCWPARSRPTAARESAVGEPKKFSTQPQCLIRLIETMLIFSNLHQNSVKYEISFIFVTLKRHFLAQNHVVWRIKR